MHTELNSTEFNSVVVQKKLVQLAWNVPKELPGSGELKPSYTLVFLSQVSDALEIAVCRHLSLSYLRDVVDRVRSVSGLAAFHPDFRSRFEMLDAEADAHIGVLMDDGRAAQHGTT